MVCSIAFVAQAAVALRASNNAAISGEQQKIAENNDDIEEMTEECAELGAEGKTLEAEVADHIEETKHLNVWERLTCKGRREANRAAECNEEATALGGELEAIDIERSELKDENESGVDNVAARLSANARLSKLTQELTQAMQIKL